MRKLSIILVLLCVAFQLYAQDPPFRVDGTILNGIGLKPEAGVRVYVQQDGKVIGEVVTQANGKYDLKVQVDYAKTFDLYFKKDNYFSKRILFNYTKLNPEDDLPAGDVRPWSNANIEIVAKSSGAQLAFLESEPVAKFGNGVSPVPDKPYNDNMKAKVKAAMDALTNQENNKDLAYQKAIKEADDLYLKQKKYSDALAKYEEASSLKPSEQYPIKRIDELDALIKAERETNLNNLQADSEYYNLIKAGDALRDQKKYPEAVIKYKEALQKKNEQYPQDEIDKLEKIIEDQQKEAENLAKYNEAVKQADMFYNQKSYEAAREKYTIANKLKPNEAHPKMRLDDLNKKIADLAAKKELKQKYDDLVNLADELFTQEKWAESKAKYQEAFALESASSYPTDRIALCDEKITALQKEKERADKIATLIKEGGDLFVASKWTDAKLKYSQVLQLDNTNAESISKLAVIDEKIKNQEAEAAKEQKWTKLVQEADAAVQLLQWSTARAKYVEALGLKQTKEVQDKLDNVLLKIKQEEDKVAAEAKFQELKKQGLALVTEKKWQEAKLVLTEAKSIKEDQVVNVKLAEAEKNILQETAANKVEEEYQAAIRSAQEKELAGEIDQAIAFYKTAEAKKPIEKLPKDKIKELELIKIEKAKQIELNQKYTALMKKGDQWMLEKNYVAAIKEYNQALLLKPTEKEPVDKAAEAERLEKEKNSETDQLFNKMIEASEKELELNNFSKAREYADRALKNRPDESKPKELLTRITKLEKEFKDYEAKMLEAKVQLDAQKLEIAKSLYLQASSIRPNEKEPKDQIDEINRRINESQSLAQVEEKYKVAMAKASDEFKKNNFSLALDFYQKALDVKPGDQLAKDKIDELKQVIDNEQNKLKANAQKETDLKNLIAEGDRSFSNAEYEAALVTYENALKLQPNDQAIKQKIENTKTKLNDVKVADKLKQYNNLIKKADDLFKLKNYSEARLSYEKAREEKPNDNYPKRKLDEIDVILNSQSASKFLPDLGAPIENSSIDGYALLVKADIERKNAQSSAIDSKVNAVNKAVEQADRITSFSIQTTSNYLLQFEGNNGTTTETAEEKNKRTISYLEEVADQLAKEAAKSAASQDEQTRNALAKITAIDQKVNVTERDNTNLYDTNNERIKSIEIGAEDGVIGLLRSDANQSVNMNETLKGIEFLQQKNATIAHNEAIRNNRDLTKQVEGAVNNQSNYITATDRTINDKQEVITSIVLKSQNVNTTDRQLQLTNERSLVSIQEGVSRGQEKMVTAEDLSMQQTGSQIERIRNQAEAAMQNQNNQGLVTNDAVDGKVNRIKKAEQLQVSKEQANGIDQGERVTKIDDNINREIQRQTTNTIDNSSKIKQLEANLASAQTTLLTNEKDESIKVDAKVNRLVNGQTAQQTELTSKERSMKHDYIEVAENASGLQSVTDRKLSEQSYEHGVQIDNRIHSTKQKPKTPNEIGLHYPEGVTEENFTRSDSFGYITTYITRRVVVTEGQGDVYVRTQTIENTTFSKNGKPITEEAWIQFTQHSDLVKHTKP